MSLGRFRLKAVLAMTMLVALAAALVSSRQDAAPGTKPLSATASISQPITVRVLEEPAGQVHWEIARQSDSSQICLDVVGVDPAGSDEAKLGGCWARSDEEPLQWSIGGVEIGGSWFNVVYGLAGSEVASVRISTQTGDKKADDGVRSGSGAFLLVVPGDPMEPAADVVQIEALGSNGQVVARRDPPSLSSYRRAGAARSSHDGHDHSH
jgi:hypothetical protein